MAQLERGLQILLDPDLHHHYCTLLRDSTYPVPFLPYTVGYLLASGIRRKDRFIVDRILRYSPILEQRTVCVPLRALQFEGPLAIYHDGRRKFLIQFNTGVLPLPWTEDWNDWVRFTLGSMQATADFLQQTRFHRREGKFEPVAWQRPAVHTLVVQCPEDVVSRFEQARVFWERFGRHAETIALLRSRIEREPVEVEEAQRWCQEQGLSMSIDAHLVNWRPDYQEFYYEELARRARQIYLFRNEYLFVLGHTIMAEIPKFGHASYFFHPPGELSDFLRAYAQTIRHPIRRHSQASRTTLGYRGRLSHLRDGEVWRRNLRKWVEWSESEREAEPFPLRIEIRIR